MTYRSLKKFIKDNKNQHNTKIFDLVSNDIQSKIIFVIGDKTSSIATFLCSILNECQIEYFHFSSHKTTFLNEQFFINKNCISLDLICERAEQILKITTGQISNSDLCLLLSLSFCKKEYAIFEIDEEYYQLIKDKIPAFALILSFYEKEKVQKYIDNANESTKSIFFFSETYEMRSQNKNGAKLKSVNPENIYISKATLVGTNFYHANHLYFAHAINQNLLPLAFISIEAAKELFDAPRANITKGLTNASLPCDIKLYSICPNILLYEGNDDFALHHTLKHRAIGEGDDFSISNETTLFYGSKDYIEKVKISLKNKKK